MTEQADNYELESESETDAEPEFNTSLTRIKGTMVTNSLNNLNYKYRS